MARFFFHLCLVCFHLFWLVNYRFLPPWREYLLSLLPLGLEIYVLCWRDWSRNTSLKEISLWRFPFATLCSSITLRTFLGCCLSWEENARCRGKNRVEWASQSRSVKQSNFICPMKFIFQFLKRSSVVGPLVPMVPVVKWLVYAEVHSLTDLEPSQTIRN